MVALIQKILSVCILFSLALITANGQKIVVDTASTNKYIVKRSNIAPQSNPVSEPDQEISFSERALSIGNGILNRLKARLNLEEAAESIMAKKERILGTKPDDEGG